MSGSGQDKLFLQLGEIIYTIKKKGMLEVNIVDDKENFVQSYLKLAMDLLKEGRSEVITKTVLDSNLDIICSTGEIGSEGIISLHIIKNLIEAIRVADYEFLMDFSKYYTDYKIYDKLFLLFKEWLFDEK